MKGIIFNLLEDFIVEKFGENKYEEIIASCALQTNEPFVGPGSYPDEDFFAIYSKALEHLKIPSAEALRTFGKYCFHKLASKYPIFIKMHNHPKDFLKSVDSTIHVEVRKLYKDSETPKFTYRDPAPNKLIMEYTSKRKLCNFAEGLIEGVSEHYKIPIQCKQLQCTLNGNKVCEFDLTFG